VAEAEKEGQGIDKSGEGQDGCELHGGKFGKSLFRNNSGCGVVFKLDCEALMSYFGNRLTLGYTDLLYVDIMNLDYG
jgi:hypothetical protein